MRRHTDIAGVDPPAAVMQINGDRTLQQVHVGVPQALNGTDILPVAAEAVGAHLFAPAKHLGDDILAEILGALGVQLIRTQVFAQLRPGKHIHAHRCLVGFWVLGFFLKLGDPALIVRVHNAKAAGFLPGHRAYGDRSGSFLLDVLGQHVGIIHLVDMVAREDEDVVRIVLLNKCHVLVYGIGSARIPLRGCLLHVGGQNKYAAA